MRRASASAHPNIALVKYWGKSPDGINIPATPSLSVTVDGLATTASVSEASQDRVVLDGQPTSDVKIAQWLSRLRSSYPIPPVEIDSASDFPANCGLASSSSGFAALTVAINKAFQLGLDGSELSLLARLGSVSAARSMKGGFVSLHPRESDCLPRQVHDREYWGLRIVVAVTDVRSKSISSTEGMRRSEATSKFYDGWRTSTEQDYLHCREALQERDFKRLAEIAERSCCNLHALMLSSSPPLIYWNAGTMAAIGTIRKLQDSSVPVFFTSDAGPQIKAFCLEGSASTVEENLRSTPGVMRTMSCGIGGPPTVQ